MRIHSDRRHAFAATPEALWAAMAQVDSYRTWWPWLRHLEATVLGEGERWRAVVQPPVPYRLAFELRLHEVVATRRVTAEVTGDIAGVARIEIERTDDGSSLHVVSDLRPVTGVLRAVGRLAPPVARFGHDWVLDAGLRQFRRHALD